MNGVRLKFFWLPKEIIYYVIIPMLVILFAYLIFALVYRRKKGTYYYDYVVDYVYSTLGILFCALLFCLLLGYSIATLQILIVNRIIMNYVLLAVIIAILPIIPTCFLIYVIRVYIKNLKRKSRLDKNLELSQQEQINYQGEGQEEVKNEYQQDIKPKAIYEDVELVKKNG